MTSVADGLDNILDAITQPVVALDTEHRVTYANAAAAEITGHDSVLDLLGTAVPADGFHSAAAAGRTHPARHPAGPPERGSGTLTGADGFPVPVEWAVLPLDPTQSAATVYVLRAANTHDRPAPGWPTMPSSRMAAAWDHTLAQRRIADVLQHGAQERLAGALLSLRLAEERLGADGTSQETTELLALSIHDAEEALAQVRWATAATYPGALAARGLHAALTGLAASCPVPVTVSGSLAGRLPAPVEWHVYFMIEAALERAVRQVGASAVRVHIDVGDHLVATVVDNGTPPGPSDPSLALVADRVSAVDGTLEVDHAPASSTTLRAVIPLPPDIMCLSAEIA